MRWVLAKENLINIFSVRTSRTKSRKQHLLLGSSGGSCTAEITVGIKFALERKKKKKKRKRELVSECCFRAAPGPVAPSHLTQKDNAGTGLRG